jgi:hypothetical protein
LCSMTVTTWSTLQTKWRKLRFNMLI